MLNIPGVETREQDYSSYVAGASKTSLGIVGTATKGPVGTVEFISNPNEFVAKFGSEDPECLAVYAAFQFLSQGNQLWFSRVVGDGAAKAEVTVKSEGEDPEDAVKFLGRTLGTGHAGVKVSISAPKNGKQDLTVIDRTGRATEKFTVSLNPQDPDFIVKVLSNKSKEIDAEYLLEEPVTLAPGTYTLQGGDNGVSTLTTGDIIGSPSKPMGLELLKSKSVDINLLIIPGVSDPEVVQAACSVAETRGDCLYIVDPPKGLNAQQVVEWHNGTGDYTDHAAFNSSFAALYWSWQEIYDATNDVRVWVPPSGLVAAAYAYNDNVSEVWYAPAGLKRGLIKNVIRSEFNPDDGEMTLMYTEGNCVNPIIKDPKAGLAIFGQKTLQRNTSATDRVNVRRLLLYLRKVISSAARYLSFNPNDRITWNEFEDLVEPILRAVKTKRGLYDYKIVMNSTTVTSDEIDNYRMPGSIYLKPTKAAETIAIDFVLTRTGAEFNSNEI